MPSTDHPWLLVAASIVCIALAFPLGRFFFDDFESFLDEVGLSSDPNRELWRLIFFPGSPMLLLKVIGFLGLLFIAFIAFHWDSGLLAQNEAVAAEEAGASSALGTPLSERR